MKDKTERYKQKQKGNNTNIQEVVEHKQVRKKQRKLDGNRMINRKIQREDKENERTQKECQRTRDTIETKQK